MMALPSRRDLLTALIPRYRAANHKERERILAEFVATTGYNRKYASHILHHPPAKRHVHKRQRERTYDLPVEQALVSVWNVANCIAAKRLVPCLPEFVHALERHGELHLGPDTKRLLLAMSISTADRLLHPHRHGLQGHGLATTKPGSLLKKTIPVRTFADWDDARPGFVEIDLVAHCGESVSGQYLNSLNMTDIATAWTEPLAVLNKSQLHVSAAIVASRQRFPFPLLGLDADNGAEFINDNLARYCEQEGLTFTRSRPYQKNDQAHVEQKNWSIVRHFVGYDRLEGAADYHALAALYQPLRLYVNFFQPVQKLVSKERVGGQARKHYDRAKTPYQRVLEDAHVSEQAKQGLRKLYLTLNPADLLRQIEKRQNELWARSRIVKSGSEATG